MCLSLELPDYTALLLLLLVLLVLLVVLGGSSLSLRAAVSLSRPLPEEWVIICPQRGQIIPAEGS